MISSHFIYHFNKQELSTLLKKLRKLNIQYAVFSELYHSQFSYYLFKTIAPFLPIHKIAKNDGLLAIQNAYTIKQFKEVLKGAAVKYSIKKRPFFRAIIKIQFETKL